MKERILSVFVDESGSFDSSVFPSRFYIVTCLFHDQRESIAEQLCRLEDSFAALGMPDVCIHAGPLIRREDEFRDMDIVLRRKLFGRMVAFTRSVPICYQAFTIDKTIATDAAAMISALKTEIELYLAADGEWLGGYDRINIYYDDGQDQVKSLLTAAFAAKCARFISGVKPENYRLFQSADLLCTVELLGAKLEAGVALTKSEEYFFDRTRDLKKNVINPLRRLVREPVARIADPIR